MRAGEVVWAELDKERLCVVIAVRDGEAIVLPATGTFRGWEERAEIDHKRRVGIRFKLTKKTYFYASDHRRITDADVNRSAGLCPTDLFQRINEIVALAALSLPEPETAQSPTPDLCADTEPSAQ